MDENALAEPDVRLRVGIGLAGVVKRYSGKAVLDDVTLDIAGGTVHALVGANGAGKSTLGMIIAGVTRPDGGTVLLGGKPVRWRQPSDARRAGISLIGQELALAPELTVTENVFLGIESRRGGFLSRREMRRRYEVLAERWGLELDRDARVGRLRLADQQKVEILRAVAADASVIVMDEPTSSLTHVETEILHRMIRDLRERGRTVVYVSHFLDAVLEVADDVSVLRSGRLVASAPTSQVSKAGIVEHMFGAPSDTRAVRHRRSKDAPVVLEVSGLTRGRVLRDVSLSIRAGEVVGLAGLVGSGRSELARAIFGVDRLDAGRIVVEGVERRIRSPREAIGAGIGFVPESRKEDGLFLELPLASNLTFAALRAVASRLGVVKAAVERPLARRLIGELGIVTKGPEAKVGALSGGNQQKVLFGKWLVRRPAVLLLDEPTRGVDVGARAAIHQIIGRLADDGVGILVISSEFEEVIALSDRLLVMREGRIAEELEGDPPLRRVMDAAFGLVGHEAGVA